MLSLMSAGARAEPQHEGNDEQSDEPARQEQHCRDGDEPDAEVGDVDIGRDHDRHLRVRRLEHAADAFDHRVARHCFEEVPVEDAAEE